MSAEHIYKGQDARMREGKRRASMISIPIAYTSVCRVTLGRSTLSSINSGAIHGVAPAPCRPVLIELPAEMGEASVRNPSPLSCTHFDSPKSASIARWSAEMRMFACTVQDREDFS